MRPSNQHRFASIRGRRGAVAALLGLAALALATDDVVGQSATGKEAIAPKRHFSVTSPGELTKTEAITVYDTIAQQMADGYAGSRDPRIDRYLTWRRYNDAPYRSRTHGNRYVNNYANAIARDAGYGDYEAAGPMPPGAVLAKDSFTFTADNAVFSGALFLMEKLEPGASPATGDWRYTMIMPDGSFFGDSLVNPQKLAFCHDCHLTQADQDMLFFLPTDYRRQFLNR